MIDTERVLQRRPPLYMVCASCGSERVLDSSAPMTGVRTDARSAVGFHGGLGHGDLRTQLFASAQAIAIVLGEDEQHEGVDAAVRVTQADADVVRVDECAGGLPDAEVDDLDDVVGRPADKEQGDNHQNRLGGAFGPYGLLALDTLDGAKHVVQRERVECADDDEGNDETQGGLVKRVPVHITRPIQVDHAHGHVLFGHHFGVYHDWDA